MKTKNAPKDLKCKINHTFFFGNRGSQKGGRGGGSDTWEKFPKNPVFFLGGVPKKKMMTDLLALALLLLPPLDIAWRSRWCLWLEWNLGGKIKQAFTVSHCE